MVFERTAEFRTFAMLLDYVCLINEQNRKKLGSLLILKRITTDKTETKTSSVLK